MLRELALELLDDEYGITSDAWTALYALFVQSDEDCDDIARALKGQDGRVYLPSDHNIEP